ncbi:galactosylceramide sulfotransferase-like isoform X2 [Acropora muricata]|uniref:galactosylceramide sulfotransferase-like isoform X2 n=1 Tax=Acropora muricata TaxID=159855 RepID=UPI0034E3AF79
MKFMRFLLISFLVLCLLCITAILLLPRIQERNFLPLQSKTLARSAQGYMKKALPSSDPTFESSTELSRKWEPESDDGEFITLLRDATEQGNGEDKEEIEEEKQNSEASTEAGVLSYDEMKCQPHNKIAFLKTHKTGSSTLTNILNRYADLNELIIALPRQSLYRFGWPGYFRWSSVDLLRLNGQPASILCNHARYRRQEMDIIMHNNTKYITILRDPVYQFESTFHYMELYRYFNLANSLNPMEVFLSKPREHLLKLRRTSRSLPDSIHLVRNGMFFDLGLSPALQEDEERIWKAIKRLESEFSLVLIMEYFDESLVLLKREFCWDLDDVIYVKQNERKTGENPFNNVSSPQLKDKIREWNKADLLLYEHFNKTFWSKIKQHGQEFYNDLAELKRKNEEIKRDCVSPEEVTEIAFRLTGQIRAFKLNKRVSSFNRYLCQKMLTNEINYINYFRSKLHPNSEYQKQLRAAGKAPPLTKSWESVIAKRIRAQRGQIYGQIRQPQFFPLRAQIPQQVVSR